MKSHMIHHLFFILTFKITIQTCFPNCKTCNDGPNSTYICSACDDRFALSASSCTPCTTGCNACSPSSCSSCDGGYYLDSPVCKTCTGAHCSLCPGDICNSCNPNYGFIIPTVQCQSCAVSLCI